MQLGLEGQTAVVTGAGKGIGLAIVQALVGEGVFVVAGSRESSSGLSALVDDGAVRFVQVDLTDPAAPAQLVEATGGRLDILVNNVGGAPARTDGFLAVTDEMWLSTLTLNLLAAVRTTRCALPLMLAAGGGSVVTTSSVNAKLADPGVIDYSAAKAALANWSKSMSKEYGARGVRFNTVSPGPVATDLWLGEGGVAQTVAKASGLTPDEVRAGATAGVATGRFSEPHEVADAVLFLASRRAGNITGADVTIDGGLQTTW